MLHLLPDELLVAIVEYCDHETRKNLSLVSRRLRNPSQYILFKVVLISRTTVETMVAVKGGVHLPDVLQNNRLLSYIQTFTIKPETAFYHLDTSIMVPIFTALQQMQPLRDIRLSRIPFTTTMLDRLCEVLSTRLYNVKLSRCSYPADYTIQQAALRIHRLVLWLRISREDVAPPHTTIKVLAAITQRSLSNIESLTLLSNLPLSSDLGVLAYLGTMPRLIRLKIKLRSGSNDEGLSNFLVANPQLVEFTLDAAFYGLTLLPPSALPNLRTIGAYNAEMIEHLVPGRPVAKVKILKLWKFKVMVDGLPALSRSAAPIVELTLSSHNYVTYLYDVLGAVVKVVPRLERMSLSFRAELSQAVLDHLVRLGSLREVDLSVYVSSEQWHNYAPERAKIERDFREGLKCSIHFNWSQFTCWDEWSWEHE